MKLVLLGAPGSGKGTQSQLLIKNQGMIQFSTGDLLRKAVSEKTELGLKAKDIMDEGHLVPDDLVIGLIREKLKGVSADQGVIFDGFPRTLPQAEALEGLLKEFHFSLNKAVYIKVPQQELIKRLAGRRSCSECGAAYHLHYNPPKKEGICDRCGSHDLIQRRDDPPEVIQENKDKANAMQEKMDSIRKSLDLFQN